MTATVQVGKNHFEVDDEKAKAYIEEHLGLTFEYVRFDNEGWAIQLKTPGRKVVIRPTQIGREMKFEIVLC